MASHNPTPLTTEDRHKIFEELDMTHTNGKDWIIRRYEATIQKLESMIMRAGEELDLDGPQ